MNGFESRPKVENPAVNEARQEGYKDGYIQASRDFLELLNEDHRDVDTAVNALEPEILDLDPEDPENQAVLASLEHSARVQAVVSLVIKSLKDRLAELVRQVNV